MAQIKDLLKEPLHTDNGKSVKPILVDIVNVLSCPRRIWTGTEHLFIASGDTAHNVTLAEWVVKAIKERKDEVKIYPAGKAPTSKQAVTQSADEDADDGQ